MKGHLSQRQLIEHEFKLADSGGEEIAEHLKLCRECRERAERLRRKFAALELLRGEGSLSEEQISQVVAEATRSGRKSVVRFWTQPWFYTAAAVFLIALLLVIPKGSERRHGGETAKEPQRSRGAAELPIGRKVPDRMTVLSGISGQEASGSEISTEPPFAPASAIELVVLPRRESVQLTVYNSADLTLVRERRNLTLKRGWNWLQFMWANTLIDPTSLHLKPLEHSDKIEVEQLVFPPRLTEVGRWLIRSQISGRAAFEITYFTSGLGWRAFYMGTLSQDERRMRLEGYVRVANSSGEDYENARTRLIVGTVHLLDEIAELARRKQPYGRPGRELPDGRVSGYGGYGGARWFNGAMVDLADYTSSITAGGFGMRRPKEIRKEGLSEYFLYTIEGTETIPDKWGKRLISFDVSDIEVESLYKYDEERWGGRTIRFVKFANDQEHNLGQTPIPDGAVKIYAQADGQGHLSYVGGTNVKYIPVDEEVELNLGPAREVVVEPVLTDFATENYVFDRKGNVAGWDEIRTWEIEVTNTRPLPVEVEITRGFQTAYWTVEAGAKTAYEKHDAEHIRFNEKLAPRTERKIKYKVRTFHGERRESITLNNHSKRRLNHER